MSDYLWGWDSVDFAFGLKEYNLSKYQPHFPGYPVYMLFAKLLFSILKNDIFSLTLTSAIFGSLTILPFYYLASSMYDKQTALLSSLLLMINPLHWLLSIKALSDVMGVFFIVSSAFLLYRAAVIDNKGGRLRFLTWASLTLGIGLGVRISYFPHLLLWGFVLLVCYKQVNAGSDKTKIILYPFLALTGSILAWVIGQSIVLGYSTFINEGMIFLKGHFGDWGGTIFTHPNVLERIKELLIQDIFIHGLGGGGGFLRFLVTLLTALSILFYLYRERFDFHNIFLIIWGLPYLLWVFYGQNLNNPRHILACTPILMLIISRGAIYITDLRGFPKKTNFSYAFIIALLVSLFYISFNLVSVHAQKKSSLLKLVDYVKKEYDPTRTIIFCWEAKRLFDYYAPEYITVREDSVDIEASVAFYFYGKPEIILVTSDMIDRWGLKVKKLKYKLDLIKHFNHNPYAQNAHHSIFLYQLES